ncbi:MAG: EF2563 family selenium-dependent molybdenum hydroxylase system protein [Desulfobacteraceae bacterium]|nr:MAG: EF2563 family selenium-dependent molybdenum hydroxylase system protein [Desulfobacteraceae bacterium]
MKLHELTVGIKGAGELASGIACRLFHANIRHIFMMERANPLAVRRHVSFCESVFSGTQTVEQVTAQKVESSRDIRLAWEKSRIAVLVDPEWLTIRAMTPDVVIDATIAKRNLGTSKDEAPLVIALGPGFEAGKDAHLVVETHRGHHLGRVIRKGPAQANTGIPGNIHGFTHERVLRAPADGFFESNHDLGMIVQQDETVGHVSGRPVTAKIPGVLRGLIKPGTTVSKGLKVGDIDPRAEPSFCRAVSDKSRALGGGVLEAILSVYNRD